MCKIGRILSEVAYLRAYENWVLYLGHSYGIPGVGCGGKVPVGDIYARLKTPLPIRCESSLYSTDEKSIRHFYQATNRSPAQVGYAVRMGE